MMKGDTVYSTLWGKKAFLVEACDGDYTGLVEPTGRRLFPFSNHRYHLSYTRLMLVETTINLTLDCFLR